MNLKSFLPIRSKRFGYHHRPEIGASDSDVDDIGYALAGVAPPCAAANLVGKNSHLGEHSIDSGHHILAINFDRPIAPVTQRDVEYRAAFSEIDPIATKHPLDK